jgi:nucleotide-binding universal stress UspA family protein
LTRHPKRTPVRTIVVGVDGSEPSIRALTFAASLVEDLPDAQLVIAHARYVSHLWAPEHLPEAEFADLLDEAERFVRETAERKLEGRDLRWSIERREGEPAHVLRDIAHETDASFVVVGRRGWSTVQELMLGSVSNRLVHRSDVRVLLVR